MTPSPHPEQRTLFGGFQFGRKIGTGFAATLLLAVIITFVSVYALRCVVSANDRVAFNHAQDLFDVHRLRTVAQQKVAIARGYLLTRDGLFVADARMADNEFRTIFDHLTAGADNEFDREQLAALRQSEQVHERALQRAYELGRDKRRSHARLSRYFNNDVMPKFDAWERALTQYVKLKERQMEEARRLAREAGSRALRLILLIAAAALGMAVWLALVLTRTLTRVHDRLQVAVRAREDVLAIVSHDLKNPLSSVLLSSSMLMRNPEMPADARARSARTIHTSGQQMKKLIEDLLDFVKVEFGGMKVTKRAEDANALLADIMAVFTPLAREKGISLHRTIAGDVSTIECDRSRVFQVLSNLMGNAIKFTPREGKVSLHVSVVGGHTLFWVRDTGPGIKPELLTRVFDRYWQSDNRERQSVGLGLAIAKGLVEAHGGRIWVESKPEDGGSTFYFTLPNAGYRGDDADAPAFSMEGLKTVLKRPPAKAEPRCEPASTVADD